VVCTVNYKILIKACERYGADIDKLFELYTLHPKYNMTHHKKFISLPDALFFHECAKKVLFEKGVFNEDGCALNPRFHKELGFYSGKHQSMGKGLDFIASFLSLKQLYDRSPDYVWNFNSTQLHKKVYNNENKVIYLIKYFENYKDFYDFQMIKWPEGLYAGLSASRGLLNSKSKLDYNMFDILNTFKKNYNYLNIDFEDIQVIKEKDSGLNLKTYFFRNLKFAHDIFLEKEILTQEKKK
jgi:hypothetical protein